MNNINYNNDEMKKLLKLLEKTMNEFTIAINSFSNLDIPEFDMSTYLRGCTSLLNNYKENCKKDIEWINNCITSFSNFNSNSIGLINTIDVEIIKSNSMKIK